MSTNVTAQQPDPGVPAQPGRGRSLWSGLWTVARLELRRPGRSARWATVLLTWTALLGGLTPLSWSVAQQLEDSAGSGRIVFAVVVFLVLSLGALVVPALWATSINGDRASGVLASLQTTLLTPAQIVLGKLLAAWIVALALLGCALPFMLWACIEGDIPLVRLLANLLLLAVILLVFCAVSLGWSAVAARTWSSVLLTYLTVALLTVGLPQLYAMSTSLVRTDELVTVGTQDFDTSGNTDCVTRQEKVSVSHSERTWWLLVASPYVIIADAAARHALDNDAAPFDPLTQMGDGFREARLGPDLPRGECVDLVDSQHETQRAAQLDRLGMTWPYGLAALLLLGGAFTTIAIRRLRTPS